MNVPHFDPDELGQELEKVYGRAAKKRIQRPLVALFGTASCDRVDTAAVGPVEVCVVGSELELRRNLPDPHDDGRRIAYLVGWPDSKVPVDLESRFVQHGKILRVGKADRLRKVFAVGPLTVIDPQLVASKLANLLVAAPPTVPLHTTAGRVTLDLAYEAWLRVQWRLGEGASLGLDTLLAWAASSGRDDQWRDLVARPEAEGVADELRQFLERRVSDVAPRVWDLWAEGKGRELFEFALLFEALVDGKGSGPVAAIRTACKHRLGLAGDAFESVWQPLGRAVDTAMLELARLPDSSFVRQRLHDAQAHLDPSDQSELIASRRLPIAWTLRLDALGQTLGNAAKHAKPAAVEQALEDLRLVEAHALSRDPAHESTLERAVMATRLLAWLVVRTDKQFAVGRHTYADAEALALWYAQEGGYVDWARWRVRGSGESAFGKGVAKVLAEVDAIRLEMDRRFAKGIVSWHEEHRPTHKLLPIDDAVKVFAAPFLERNPQRRLLVILVDGMAWAQAVSVMHSLAEGGMPWQPIAWNTEAVQGGTHFFTPVIASLPSVTSISRSAFFAGKPIKPGKAPNTGDNPKHWAANKALASFFDGAQTPKLLLRGDGFKTDGSAAPEALTLISDTTQRIVAVVVNAIDETLKADTQAQGAWTADQIGPLRELLQAALAVGRAVMLASDHGHVFGGRLSWTQFGSGAGSSRWRPWKDDDVIHEYEVAISHEHTWAPKGDGVRGVICLADDTHSYSNQTHYGEHGGATLAELVAPTFVIGCENLQGTPIIAPDRSLETRPFPTPAWWNLDVRQTVGQKEAAGTVERRRKPRIAEEREELGQLTIAPAASHTPPVQPTAAVPAELHVSAATKALLAKLEKHPVFAARTEDPATRAQTLRALEFLLERNNHAAAGAFAEHLGKHEYRAPGLVTNLAAVLNQDGYAVVRFDPAAKQVVLELQLLKTGFGL